jgi:uncharacterized protein (TIGR00255 family)
MPHSMTGFASLAVTAGPKEYTWEIRSVNHRFLDIGLRLPEEARSLETACRELAARFVKRGKVDCTLRASQPRTHAARRELDAQVVEDLHTMQARVRERFPDARVLSVAEVLRFDGVVIEVGPTHDDDDLGEQLLGAFREALAALVDARAAEGARIAEFIGEGARAIDAAVAEARPLLPEAARRYREKLMARIERLDVTAQPERLEQELAIVAQRMDIVEELDRLNSHTAEIQSILARAEPIGRRLDFLIQELNREANTMTSKSQDEELTRIAVDLKVVIEQMREQAQNLE